MSLERRNEPQMLRTFHKMYPSYNLNPLLRRRHQQLVEAQAFILSECNLSTSFPKHVPKTGETKLHKIR